MTAATAVLSLTVNAALGVASYVGFSQVTGSILQSGSSPITVSLFGTVLGTALYVGPDPAVNASSMRLSGGLANPQVDGGVVTFPRGVTLDTMTLNGQPQACPSLSALRAAHTASAATDSV
jgi:hypothetical protein